MQIGSAVPGKICRPQQKFRNYRLITLRKSILFTILFCFESFFCTAVVSMEVYLRLSCIIFVQILWYKRNFLKMINLYLVGLIVSRTRYLRRISGSLPLKIVWSLYHLQIVVNIYFSPSKLYGSAKARFLAKNQL